MDPLLVSSGVAGTLAPGGAQAEFISEYRWRMPDGRVYLYSPETQGKAFMVEGPSPSEVNELKAYQVAVDESRLKLIKYVAKEPAASRREQDDSQLGTWGARSR